MLRVSSLKVIKSYLKPFKKRDTVSFQIQYQQKRLSAADAIRVVMNGDTIVVPTGVGEPPALLTALSEARRDFQGVQVVQILPVRKYGYCAPEARTAGSTTFRPIFQNFRLC